MVAPSNVSTSTVISSLTVNLIVCGIFVVTFLLLRLSFKRIYSPKSSFELVPEEKKPEPLPKDPFSWIIILLRKPDSFILQHTGLDGFFFLRYLRVFAFLFLFGLLMYIILLPVNATNGNDNGGFDKLSIANVINPKRYYAHALMGWVWYGLVIFVIYRELFFFNSMKNVVASSPKYAQKLSSRTILFQSVPNALLDEKQFFKLFNGVKRVYVPRSTKELESKVEKRANLVSELELAENKLLKMAVKRQLKAEKKGESLEPRDEISAYVPENKRPKGRLEGFFSKKVDIIRYCQEEIPKIDSEIKKLQKKFRRSPPFNSIFVEFDNQYYAQLAYQSSVHHNPLRMKPCFIGIEPEDIQWSNLRLFWWERIVRRFLAFAAITAVVIFWAIPVAFVGIISNVTYLTNKIPWLEWILNMPKPILGVITGILPTAMLALLMLILPLFVRGVAVVAGAPSAQSVEIFTQNSYFAFLMVNGFLVTALASSATATVTRVLEDPRSVLNILANNLPLSSNFYISYLTLQGLSLTGATLLQVVGFFLYYILGSLFDNTVRKKWTRFSKLGSIQWGTVFPLFTQLACITLSYSIISPLIIMFACVAFFLVYIAYCYNLSYVFVESADVRGMHYPRALFQTFTGIYIGQICMLGIFVVGRGWGPIVLQAIGLLSTVFCHFHLKEAFDSLLEEVPMDCMRALDGVSDTPSFSGYSEYESKVLRARNNIKDNKEDGDEEKSNSINSQDVEANEETSHLGHHVPLLADRDFKKLESKNSIIRYFRPDVFLNFRHSKRILPASYNMAPEEKENKHAYDPPAISAKCPDVWIPKDKMGLSDIEIEKLKGIVKISNENATFDEKGKIVYLGKPPV